MLCDSKMCRRDFIASNVRILRLFMSALVSSFVPKSLHSFQFVDVFSGVTGCMLAIQSSSDHNTFLFVLMSNSGRYGSGIGLGI